MRLGKEDYVGLHQRYARLLEGSTQQLNAAQDKEEMEKARKELSARFKDMMKALFRQEGAQLNIEVVASNEAQKFIESHAAILDSSFKEVEMTDTMRSRLQRSNYIFSGMKAFHEMNEAFPSLLDEKGNRKTFERFLNDVQKIDKTYNRNYLRAEYNFVHNSAQMAAKWEAFMEDGDHYNLQYRTAADGKVRPEHAALHNVTLPPSDPFWEEFCPPNGWNCRCTVVQVRKSKYPVTDHNEAMALGEEATGKDTNGIFRFNPGKERKAVPDYNPYTIRRCRDCNIAKGKLDLAKPFIPDNELCAACELLHKCVGQIGKSARAIERRHYIDKEMAPLLEKTVIKKIKGGAAIEVRFNKDGNGHIYSDVLGRTNRLNLDHLKDMDKILESATYFDEAAREAGHNNPYEYFYYFITEVDGKKIRLNIGKEVRRRKNGKISVRYICYSVNNA